jgi:hypothetical protein
MLESVVHFVLRVGCAESHLLEMGYSLLVGRRCRRRSLRWHISRREARWLPCWVRRALIRLVILSRRRACGRISGLRVGRLALRRCTWRWRTWRWGAWRRWARRRRRFTFRLSVVGLIDFGFGRVDGFQYRLQLRRSAIAVDRSDERDAERCTQKAGGKKYPNFHESSKSWLNSPPTYKLDCNF